MYIFKIKLLKIIALIAIILLITPSLLKASHSFFHSEHKSCETNDQVHFHSHETNCDFNKIYTFSEFKPSFSLELNSFQKHCFIELINNYKNYLHFFYPHYTLRGPPCFLV